DVVEGAVEEGGAGDGERVGGVGREPVEERERELAIEQQVGGDDQVVVLVPLQQPADLDGEQRGGQEIDVAVERQLAGGSARGNEPAIGDETARGDGAVTCHRGRRGIGQAAVE